MLRRAGCSLAFISTLQFICYVFLGQFCPSVRPNTVWTERLLNPPVTFRKSCTQDLESYHPGPFLREIYILRLGPEIIDGIFRGTVIIIFCLSHNVSVLQWYWKCLFLWFVQSNSRFIMMSVNKFSRQFMEAWFPWCRARVDNGSWFLLVSTHFALCFLLCSQALMSYIMAGMDQKDFFAAPQLLPCRYAEAVSRGAACLADHRGFAAAVRAGWSMSLVCSRAGFCAAAVHQRGRLHPCRCAEFIPWFRQLSDLGIPSCCTRWSTSLFPGRAGSLPRRGAEAVSYGPDRSSDHRDFAVAVRVGWFMSLFCWSSRFRCSLRRDSWDPTIALVFLRGHCRSHSRRCATTDAGWFRRYSCSDVARLISSWR